MNKGKEYILLKACKKIQLLYNLKEEDINDIIHGYDCNDGSPYIDYDSIIMFIECYKLIYGIIGESGEQWFKCYNTNWNDSPINVMKTKIGLIDVLNYLRNNIGY